MNSHPSIVSMFSSASETNSPSSPTRRTSLPAGLLGVPEDAEIDARVVEDARERLGVALVARVERGVVADEPEDLDRLLACVLDLEAEILRPARPLTPRLAERVARGVDRLERRLELAVHLAPLDEAPAHLVDDRDVLDPDRADLDARHALHARPERLRPDRVAEDRLRRVEERRHVSSSGGRSSPRRPRVDRGSGRVARAGSRTRSRGRRRGTCRTSCRRRDRGGGAATSAVMVA